MQVLCFSPSSYLQNSKHEKQIWTAKSALCHTLAVICISEFTGLILILEIKSPDLFLVVRPHKRL